MTKILFDEYVTTDAEGDNIAIETRYILDGATTIDEAIEFANAFIGYLEGLQQDGYELTSVISKGKGFASLDVVEDDDPIF